MWESFVRKRFFPSLFPYPASNAKALDGKIVTVLAPTYCRHLEGRNNLITRSARAKMNDKQIKFNNVFSDYKLVKSRICASTTLLEIASPPHSMFEEEIL